MARSLSRRVGRVERCDSAATDSYAGRTRILLLAGRDCRDEERVWSRASSGLRRNSASFFRSSACSSAVSPAGSQNTEVCRTLSARCADFGPSFRRPRPLRRSVQTQILFLLRCGESPCRWDFLYYHQSRVMASRTVLNRVSRVLHGLLSRVAGVNLLGFYRQCSAKAYGVPRKSESVH